MNLISTFALLASILLPASLAMPTARQQCHPNFSGRPVSIFPASRTKEWGPGTLEDQRVLEYKNPSSEAGEFYIPFTGQPDNSYYIKSVFAPANNFYATVGARAPWIIWQRNDNGWGSPWQISCTWCAPGDASTWNATYARGCTMVAHQGSCADETPYGFDYIPRVGSCNGSPSQLWEFVLPRP